MILHALLSWNCFQLSWGTLCATASKQLPFIQSASTANAGHSEGLCICIWKTASSFSLIASSCKHEGQRSKVCSRWETKVLEETHTHFYGPAVSSPSPSECQTPLYVPHDSKAIEVLRSSCEIHLTFTCQLHFAVCCWQVLKGSGVIFLYLQAPGAAEFVKVMQRLSNSNHQIIIRRAHRSLCSW